MRSQGLCPRRQDVAKFVLIDPSVQDFQGHYYEHAMRVLRAAEAVGYLPVLATNRRFLAREDVDVSVHPVYRYAVWFSLTDGHLVRPLKKVAKTAKRWFVHAKGRLVFSRLGSCRTVRNELPEYPRRKTPASRSAMPVFLLPYT